MYFEGFKRKNGGKGLLFQRKDVFRGDQNKKPHPLKDQGWDTKVFHGSTLVTAITPSLIDALTGAPDRALLPCGSEVVSSSAGVQAPCTGWNPLWESYRIRMSSSQLFSKRNLAHIYANVNPAIAKTGAFCYNTPKYFVS